MLRDGRVHYGDVLYIEGYGPKVVNDCMNSRMRNAVDMWVATREEEKRVGVRKLKVWVIKCGLHKSASRIGTTMQREDCIQETASPLRLPGQTQTCYQTKPNLTLGMD